MKIRNKQVITAISLIMMLTMTGLMAGMQSANALDQHELSTVGYITVVPNPVGVNQNVLVTFGIDKTSPIGTIRAGNFEGFTVKITKPDGTTTTTDPVTSYSMANIFFVYTPTMEGEYTFEGNFPGQWINGSYRVVNERGSWSNASSLPLTQAAWWFKPSSAKTTLTVQHDPIPNYPDIPLPTDVWTRPLNGEIKGWWQIADNWLMPKYNEPAAWRFSACAFAPYTSAPNSPHILWKQPLTFGGVAGGPYGDDSYRTGLSYEPFYSYSLVVNGRILYDDHGPAGTNVYGTRCIDLYTGEDIWYLKDVNIAFAQILQIDTGNEHGPMTYLWETTGSATNGTWRMYDAFSGNQILTITNITGTSATTRFGPNGELLSYTITGTDPNRRLIMWNSTLAITGVTSDYFSPPYKGTINGQNGIQWNVSIPAAPVSTTRIVQINVNEGYILAAYNDHTVFPYMLGQVAYPALLDRDSSGAYPTSINHLWAQNRSIYTEREAYTNIQDGVFALWDQATRQFHGYNIKTGAELWATDPVPMGWGLFTAGTMIAYGKLYSGFFDGHIRAWNITDGKLAWDYYMGDTPYLETAYGSLPAYGFTIADGKIFVSNDEHSPDSVLWRGGKLWALDAETGELVWAISGRLRQATVADGILTAENLYDNQLYTFGKGPSKTTVSAPQTQVTLGDKVMLTGTVTDQTPASKDTPAVSDESMAAWMEYLHMQKPFPSNVTGVEVTISVLDSNNNYYEIGKATSDASGTYHLWWEPEISGEYVITATYAGSNSYGSSFAQTAMGVVEAPPASPTPPLLTLPPTETYIGVGTGLIIVAIAIVGLLLLRKR